MKTFVKHSIAAILLTLSAAAMAQTKAAPDPCNGKSGDTPRDCIRAAPVVVPQTTTRPADPAAMVNCLNVTPADTTFCINRNTAIIECRKKLNEQNFDECFDKIMQPLPKPRLADCSRVKPEQRRQCTLRNQHYEACRLDPLRYFACLDQRSAKK
jgi:hypothetical protein